MPANFIGLMSGTSMDGIDAVVARFGDADVELLATLSHPYPSQLRADLLAAIAGGTDLDAGQVGSLDRQGGECFRDAALAVLQKADLEAGDIEATGSHGQTLRHEPGAARPYSLQIGDPATIAIGTGIRTVADFRRADIAAGGQGAPLVPPFHEWLFRQAGRNRVILNLGGIANVTIVPGNETDVTGFDTGPGNTLLDRWAQEHLGEPYDRDGAWAASGEVVTELLDNCLAFDYFQRKPPKSTGFEEFNLGWLEQQGASSHEAGDVQATLCELTARSIAVALRQYAPATDELFVCGGGARNTELMRRLSVNVDVTRLATTDEVGLHPDWVEATAFAWLAMRTVQGQTGNLPSVTGARRKLVLGAIHSP